MVTVIEKIRSKRWVLLPGTLCTGDVFTPLLDKLGVPTQQRVLVSLDYADVSQYSSVFDEKVEDGDIICAFSLGAIIAANNAHCLNRASMILLFGVNPLADDPNKESTRKSLEADVINSGARVALNDRLPALFGSNVETVIETILDMACKTAHSIKVQTSIALDRPNALDKLSQCQIPLIAVVGEKDDQAPPSLSQLVAQSAPLGKALIVSGLGHYAILEDANACIAELLPVIEINLE